jgi:hypothetical protein
LLHKNNDTIKLITETKIEIFFDERTTTSSVPRLSKIKITPINGKKVKNDKIGKFMLDNN